MVETPVLLRSIPGIASNVDVSAEFSDNIPARLSQFTRKGAQHHIDSLSVRLTQYASSERDILGGEDSAARDIPGAVQMLNLLS